MIRARLKQLAEHALIGSGLERFARKRRHDEVLILAYHNVLPEGHQRTGDSSLHLPFDDFVRQLDVLEEAHDVVRLENVFDAAAPTSRPRVAITFDDAYSGALTTALPELMRRGLAATMFVAPGLLGTTTWWDLLADPELGEIPYATREHALESLAGRHEKVLEWAQLDAHSPDPTLPQIGTAEELKAAQYSRLTVGSHTWSHPNLTAIPIREAESELSTSLEWLRDRFVNVLPWVSYPYGRSTNLVERMVHSAGYSGACRIDGGWVTPEQQSRPTFVPRFNVPAGLSIEGFRLRLAGLGLR